MHEDIWSIKLEQHAPKFAAQRLKGLGIAIPVVIATIILNIGLFLDPPDIDERLYVLPTLIGLGILFGIDRWVARARQKIIMPVLAEVTGFDYQQDASGFLRELPPRLLPKTSMMYAEDELLGAISGRYVRMAEVNVQKAGRSLRTLFRGVVLQFQTATPMPAFFIAPKQLTKGFFGGEMNVKGLIEIRALNRARSETLGVWLSEQGNRRQHPALDAVLDIFLDLENNTGAKFRLFSMTSNGKEIHIALRHGRDLFHAGGLLVGKKGVRKRVASALEDFQVPLQITSAILNAEQVAGQFKDGTRPRAEVTTHAGVER